MFPSLNFIRFRFRCEIDKIRVRIRNWSAINLTFYLVDFLLIRAFGKMESDCYHQKVIKLKCRERVAHGKF